MIYGTVTAAREVVIQLQVSGPNGQQQNIQGSIDTGFNDYMTLPRSVVSALGLPFEAPTQATLADGTIITLDYYRATVLWDGQWRSVPVLAANGGSLFGMSLLYGYKLTINVLDGGLVTIERIP